MTWLGQIGRERPPARRARRRLLTAPALLGLALGACGGAHHATNSTSSAATSTAANASTPARTGTSTAPPTPTRASSPPSSSTPTTAVTAMGVPVSPATTTAQAPRPTPTVTAAPQPPPTVTLSCGSIAFAPQSSYLAVGIAITGGTCRTARAVAQASRPHAYDPPAAGHPAANFSADGFACVGAVAAHSVLEVVTYRCTRGPAIVTFQRSA